MSDNTACVLIASDNTSDADMIRSLLTPEFGKTFVSTIEEKVLEDFELRKPDVLVLAFNTLEKAERYYLGLYRLCKMVQTHPHRTVILCNKDDAKRVAELCMKQHFDDYVLFWPMNYDAARLPMSVHLAVRSLNAAKSTGPTASEFAMQARHLGELEAMLAHHMTLNDKYVEAAGKAMDQAKHQMGAAIDGMSQRMGQGDLQHVVEVKNPARFIEEFNRLKEDEIHKHMSVASSSVQPLKQLANDFRKDSAPQMASMRTLSDLAKSVKPAVLVVDDDEFQHKMIAKILGTEEYELAFANSGAQTMTVLRNLRPDLILMDVMMPDVDGLEMTLRLKSAAHYKSIPIMMISGKSEGSVVVNCLKAGAIDFVVKPFDRETLKAKVAKLSRPRSASATPAAPPPST